MKTKINKEDSRKSTNKKYLITYILISSFILTACQQKDNTMHLTGQDYLHKELDEERYITSEVESRASSLIKNHGNGYAGSFRSVEELSKQLNEEATGSEPIESAITNGNMKFPISKGTWNSKYGGRVDPVTGARNAFHDGIDLSAPGGTPIVSAISGKVVTKSFMPSGWGHYLVVEGNVNGTITRTLYGHMQAMSNKNVGQPVMAGEEIGRVGTTGKSTGNHLHFEVMVQDLNRAEVRKRLSPTLFVAASNRWWYKSKTEWSRLDPIDYLDEIESDAQYNSMIVAR